MISLKSTLQLFSRRYICRFGVLLGFICWGIMGFANPHKGLRTVTIAGVPVTLLEDAPALPLPLGDFESLTIPLRKVGNLLLVEAVIDDQRGNFILDLGAPYLVLNSTYFRDYEIDDSYYAGTVNSASDYVRRARVRRLEVLDLSYKNLEADVTDLAAIENQRKVKILGLLGVDLFRHFIFDLNVRDQELILHQKKLEPEIPGKLLFSTPLKQFGNHLLVMGYLNGKKLRFSLDTGAETNMLDKDLKGVLLDSLEVLEQTRVTGASGRSAEVVLMQLTGLMLEGHELDGMRTLVGSLSTMGKAYGTSIDGMLGYPFFAQGRTLINFKKREFSMYQWEDGP